MDFVFILVGLAILLWLYFYVPTDMANNRGRNPYFWVILTCATSPLISIPLLLLLGQKYR